MNMRAEICPGCGLWNCDAEAYRRQRRVQSVSEIEMSPRTVARMSLPRGGNLANLGRYSSPQGANDEG